MSRSVLFVCLGNICRSPLAEAALRHQCTAAGLDVNIDSAGTGDWHVGHAPDERAQMVAMKNGVDIAHLRARQVTKADFRDFGFVIAMDGQNLRDLTAMQPRNSVARLSLLLDHVEGRAGEDVVDPYYGKEEGFDKTWEDAMLAAASIRQLLQTG